MADDTIANLMTGLQAQGDASAQPSTVADPAPAPQVADAPASAAGQGAAPAPQAPIEEKEVRGLYGAMMDEREKRQRAERDLADLRAKQAPPPSAPSFKDNPEAAMQATLAQQRFDISEEMALSSGTKQEDIDAAKQWGIERAKTNPGFAAEYLRARSPIGWVVQQHRRDKALADVGDDPDAFVRRRALELGYAAPAEGQQPAGGSPPASQQSTTEKPLRVRSSLASAPSAGVAGSIPVGGMTAVEALPFMSR